MSSDTATSSQSFSRSSSSCASSYEPPPPPSRNRRSSPRQRPPSKLRHYYVSRKSSITLRTTDLPLEHGAIGSYSAWGIFYGGLFLTVPLAYIYILLILLRELCVSFPDTLYRPLQHYVPLAAHVVATMEQRSSTVVEVWCVIEALFYIFLKLQLMYLQRIDPLERSLLSAPMLEPDERRVLWNRMMETERDDPVTFLSGWFFDLPLEDIAKQDIRDFCAWSMFEGRNLEHLTAEEMAQLDEFVDDIEWTISMHLYGAAKKREEAESGDDDDCETILSAGEGLVEPTRRQRPAKMFRFEELSPAEEPTFFSNLYENYKQAYEQYKSMIDSADFHPVQDFRNFMAETRQQIVEVEESAVATATHMYENAYNTLVSPGSAVDKQLSAIGHATHAQFTEAWNSVKEMRGRLETANFLATQRKRIRQQLKGYRLMLTRMRSMSTNVPSEQMAAIMRKITECNESMERLELSARDAFVRATGYARKNMLPRKEPQRFARYSSDPLLGIATYPLMFHLLILAATEIPLRVMLKKRGFSRLTVGRVAYYFHPGKEYTIEDDEEEDEDDDDDAERDSVLPIVFVHGIGIGLIAYLPFIDQLLKTGRPILLPEIPYVSGFRPWQSPNAVLPPAAVAASMTTMLATHGFLKGAFVGHSYGTSWVSYMCKYAPTAIAAAVFLDPICFCLHVPRLTKQFVYHRPDPGSISYMVRTDTMVNWTIQRSFPWQWIVLFTEDIKVPCAVFLSENDGLVPSAKVESYLKSKGAPVRDFQGADKTHFESEPVTVTLMRGQGHGDWTVRTDEYVPKIVECVEVLCLRALLQSQKQ